MQDQSCTLMEILCIVHGGSITNHMINTNRSNPHLINWPQDDAVVQKMCFKLNEIGLCWKKYIDICGLPKHLSSEETLNLANVTLASAQTELHKMCDTETSRGAFLRRTKCYHNRGVEKEVMAYKRGLEALEKMPRDSLEIKDANKFVCCFGLYVRDTIQSSHKRYCSKDAIARWKAEEIKMVS